MSSRIAVLGSGYVGTVAAAGFAHIGHEVVAVEINVDRLESLRGGVAPFYEPGLNELIAQCMAAGRLRFTSDFGDAMASSDVVFICVGTPSGEDGYPDLSALKQVAESIAANLSRHHVLVNKSTVPVGTAKWLRTNIEQHLGLHDASGLLTVVSNPEFLREGNSVHDFLYPDRIVVGSDTPEAVELLADIYRPILVHTFPGADKARPPVPFLGTSLTTAELTKYASNAFLATKISFANEIGRICDMVGADVTQVTSGMGLDPRIGTSFLVAGLGWGGSCFPKDILALIRTASEYGYRPRILRAALDVNADQRMVVIEALLERLKTLRGARIGILGLAFKPGTDDIRDSAALEVVRALQAREALVVAYDPMVTDIPAVRTVLDPYDVADGADAVVLATEWPQFLAIDLTGLAKRMRGRVFLDGRNFVNPQSAYGAGLDYIGIGRGSPLPALPANDPIDLSSRR